jgi:suppressor of ftsI
LLTGMIVVCAGAFLFLTTSSSPARANAPERVAGRAHCSSNPAPFIHDSFPEPEVRHSKHGLLDTTLHAETGPTLINGKSYVTSAYDASFPGPTLVFCPGDTVRVGLANSLDPAAFSGRHDPGTTNLHTHGLHVSPKPPQDNVFIAVPPNGRYDYQYDVPSDEPPGAYWYHPHFHGQSSPQTAAGMAGAIVVEGGLDNRPDYHDYGRRVLVIQRTALGDGVTLPTGGDVAPSFFVNGWLDPSIPIRPGEIQRWSIFNATNGFFVNLQLGAQSFELLARDGNYLAQRQQTQTLLIPPGSRREVLVQGGPAGSTDLIAVPFEQFPGDTPRQETLATVVSDGASEAQSMPAARITRLHDLRRAKVDHEHKIVYTENRTLDPVEFYINGKMFDEARVDQVMHLGDVEEWTITNSTDEWHTFHIHINDFQVTKVDGAPVDGVYNADNIEIRPGSTVTMRTRPTRYTGKFVFHCHVLGHEDLGMMATVVVKS